MMDVNVASMFLTCRAVVPRDARARRRQDREHLVGHAVPRRAVPAPLRDVEGRDRRVHARAREGARQGRRARQLRRARLHDVDGVQAHPEVVEKLRDVSVAARTIQRDQVPEDVVGAVVFLCGPGVRLRHRPDDRDRRRPVLPLILALYEHATASRRRRATASSTTSSATRRTSAQRGSTGRALVWELARRRRRRARSLPRSSSTRRRLARPLRPRRLPARRRRLPAHPPGPGHPRACSTARSGSRARRRRRTSTAPVERVVRDGLRLPGARGGVRRPSRRRSCACCCCRASGRASGRSATSTRPTRRSRSCSAPTVFFDRPHRRCEPHRRQAARRPARRPRRRHGVLRPRRELPRGARRRCYDAPIRLDHLPPRGRRREHGRGLRQADRAARGSASSRAAPGRDARLGRRAHRLPGLDAADPARRPGRLASRRSARRSRRSTTGGCSGRWRSGSRRSTAPTASRSTSRARSRPRAPGGPGPVVLALPEDMLAHETDAADARAVPRRAAAPGAATSIERLRDAARARRAAARRSSAAPAGRREASERHARVPRGERRCPPAPRSAARTALDNDSPSYVGDVGIGINPELAARVRDADLLLVVGPRLGEMTTSGYTLLECRSRGRRSSTSIPAPRSSAASTGPSCRSSRASTQFAARRARPARRAALARVDARPRAPTTRRGSSTSRCPAQLDLGDCIAHLRERVPGRDRHERRRQLHRLGAPLLALPPLPDASSRRRAARWATACPPRSPRSSSRRERTVVCFAGDGDFLMSGPGARDGGAVRPADRRPRRQQRHVRDDPHAPGAPVSGPRRRHRSRQPGLRGLARAFGAHGEIVERTEDFADAFERALPAGERPCSSCASTRRRSRHARR